MVVIASQQISVTKPSFFLSFTRVSANLFLVSIYDMWPLDLRYLETLFITVAPEDETLRHEVHHHLAHHLPHVHPADHAGEQVSIALSLL